MSTSQHHIIRQQVVEISMADPKDAASWQHRIRNALLQDAMPALEALFDQMAPSDLVVRFDRMEIDLGVIGEERIGAVLTEKLLEAFKHKLRFVQTNRPDSAEGSAESDFVIQPFESSKIGRLCFYLEHGRHHWEGGIEQEATPDLLAQQLLKPQQAELERLKKRLQENENARLRFVRLYPSDSWVKVFEKSAWKATPILQMQVWIEDFFQKNHRAGTILYELWLQYSLRAYLFSREVSALEVQELLHRFTFLTGTVVETSPMGLYPTLGKPPAADPETPADMEHGSEHKMAPDSGDEAKGTDSHTESTTPFSGDISNKRPPSMAQQVGDAQSSSGSGQIIHRPALPKDGIREREAIRVRDAGLILLHPFIGELFSTCNLLTNQRFSNELSRQKGVQLLTYLCHGTPFVPEYEVLLAKLLCGMPFGQALLCPDLTETETQHCETLLEAVVAHWKALRQTSPEALRSAFIRREGRLLLKKNTWRLHIEPNAADILLSRIPWGFSIVKLPWMDAMLYTEWNTYSS